MRRQWTKGEGKKSYLNNKRSHCNNMRKVEIIKTRSNRGKKTAIKRSSFTDFLQKPGASAIKAAVGFD